MARLAVPSRSVVVALALVLAACASAPPADDGPPRLDPDRARSLAAATAPAFAELATLCAPELWGIALCGPVLVVDPADRATVTNARGPRRSPEEEDTFTVAPGFEDVPPRERLFTGRLPTTVPLPAPGTADTVAWRNRRWAVVTSPLPEDPVRRRALLAHGSFLRVASALGVAVEPGPPCGHLEDPALLELARREAEALSRALDALAGPEDLEAALGDALAARRARRQQAAQRGYPCAAEAESRAETRHGLAEDTALATVSASEEERLALARENLARLVGNEGNEENGGDEADEGSSRDRPDTNNLDANQLTRATAPAWGLVLDRVSPGWRRELRGATPVDLGERARRGIS